MTAGPAYGQVLQREFTPELHGPWEVTPMVVGDQPCDPRTVIVHAGAPHVACKVPLEGMPTGGVVLRAEGGTASVVGGDVGDDPAVFALIDGALVLGTKGSAAIADPRVLRLDGNQWTQLHTDRFGAEIRSFAMHDGALHVATKSDGVYRIDNGALSRVGARTTIVPEGYVWSGVGDWTIELHDAALAGTEVIGAGKDLRVQRWDGTAWTTLGNVAEATYDASGVPLSYLREPKSVTVDANGGVYVGTKGMAGSVEGKDVGAVWKWDGTNWTRLGTALLKKEVKRIIAVDGVVWAGTNESGVWRWDGTTWTDASAGLPPETDGKIKGDKLILGADGALYVANKNSILKRAPTDSAWTEVGFFPNGEEAATVHIDPDGTLWVGAKVGANNGAVYRKDGASWVQLGADLPTEVKQLVRTAGGDRYAVLGGGAGAMRWNGTTWISILGNLIGDASDFKAMFLTSDVDLLAVTKVGLQRGAFQREPLEIVESALRNLDLAALVTVGTNLFAATKQDGVFLNTADATSDDGTWWTEGGAGVPDVELIGISDLENHMFVIGKRLLYSASVDASGQFTASAFGTNPGKAALDGNGNVVFAGETEFTAVAVDGDRVFAATKDGLFVTDNGGFTWELYNGPAEVKGVTIVDGVLHALVVSRTVPDPDSAPTVEVRTAALWSHVLADDVVTTPPDEDAGGCSAAGTAGFGGMILVALTLLPAVLRRDKKPKATKWLTWSRKVHTWTGVGLALFIFVEGCTGLFMIHKDDVPGLAHLELPFGGSDAKAAKLALATIDPANANHVVAATQDRLVHSQDGGASWTPVSPTSGFDKIEALAVGYDAIWVGHGEGLARCRLDGSTCAAVDLGVTGTREVRAIEIAADRIFVAFHRRGVFASTDAGMTWTEVTEALWRDDRARDDKGEHHVHGLAIDGTTVWVATSAGLFRSHEAGWAAAGLRGIELEDVTRSGDGALWVRAKKPASLFVSRDGGIGWTEVPGVVVASIAADPRSSDQVLAGTREGLVSVNARGEAKPVAIAGLGGGGPAFVVRAGAHVVAVRGARIATSVGESWQVAPAAVALAGAGKPMTLGKLLDGLHTGAVFGHKLWIVYDLGALAMILFVFTGLHMWLAPILLRRRKRAKHAPQAAARNVAESA